MRRWPRLLLLGVLAAALVPSATAGADETDASTLLARVNVLRAEQHLKPLHAQPALAGCAGTQARYIDTIQRLRHSSSDGTPASTRIRRAYRARVVGEVLGYGPSIAWITRAWMRSPIHRSVLLDRSFRSIGIGIVRDGNTYWITADLGS